MAMAGRRGAGGAGWRSRAVGLAVFLLLCTPAACLLLYDLRSGGGGGQGSTPQRAGQDGQDAPEAYMPASATWSGTTHLRADSPRPPHGPYAAASQLPHAGPASKLSKTLQDILLGAWSSDGDQWISEILKYKPGREYCKCLAKNTGLKKVIFIGDSNTRHFFLGLADVLASQASRDYAASKNIAIPHGVEALCGGNNRYVNERECHLLTKTELAACNGTLSLVLMEQWLLDHLTNTQSVLSDARLRDGRDSTLIVMNLGLHFIHDPAGFRSALVSFARFVAETYRRPIVWHLMSDEWVVREDGGGVQPNPAVHRFNGIATEVLRAGDNWRYFHLLNTTRLTSTRQDLALSDGRHYVGLLHQTKAHALLTGLCVAGRALSG